MRNSCRVLALLCMALLFATSAFSNHAQYYVLDGFGGVHAGGGTGSVAGIPYFGFDIAKGIAYVAAENGGDGVLVLDGFGGVHPSTLLGSVIPATPYFGFDIARAITYRNVPPRAAGISSSTLVDIAAVGGLAVLETVSITAPDDGFLLVIGSSYIACNVSLANQSFQLAATLTINVDSTAQVLTGFGLATFPDCTRQANGLFHTRNQTVAHLFPVAAGAHTVNLLASKDDGLGTARFLGRSLTAVFVDQGGTGTTTPTGAAPDLGALGLITR